MNPLFIIFAGNLILFGVAVIGGLRLVTKFDRYFPAAGARRFNFQRDVGDPFPVDSLVQPLKELNVGGDVLYLFLGHHCSACQSVEEALPVLVAAYSHVQFIIFGAPRKLPGAASPRVHYSDDHSPMEVLGITLIPSAIKTRDYKIAEFGIVNTGEHIESLLLA